MSSPTTNFFNDQEPETPRTPRATRHSRSRDDESLKAPKKPRVSFKNLTLDSSPPLAPSALSSTTDNVAVAPTTNLTTVRKNSREFRRSVSPAPADTEQAVVVGKPRERQAAHWVKFHKVSLGRARTAKMSYNEAVAAEE